MIRSNLCRKNTSRAKNKRGESLSRKMEGKWANGDEKQVVSDRKQAAIVIEMTEVPKKGQKWKKRRTKKTSYKMTSFHHL